MKNYELKQLLEMDKNEVMILHDISLEESKTLSIIFKSFFNLEYHYNEEDKTFIINRYQDLTSIFINQNDILVMITNSDISDNEKENLYTKEISIKNRIKDKLVYLVDMNDINKKEKVYEIVKRYTSNVIILHKIYHELKLDRDHIGVLKLNLLYRRAIQLVEYLYGSKENHIITLELVNFVKSLNVKDNQKESIEKSKFYNDLKSLNEIIEI